MSNFGIVFSGAIFVALFAYCINEFCCRSGAKVCRSGIGSSSQWRSHLDSYGSEELRNLTFSSDQEAKVVISLLWTDQLCTCPHDITPSGILVPADVIPFLESAGGRFRASPVKV